MERDDDSKKSHPALERFALSAINQAPAARKCAAAQQHFAMSPSIDRRRDTVFLRIALSQN
jgi:hypothetical protein